MRILLVIESLDGGSGRHVVDLAEALAGRDHHVCVAYSPVRAGVALVARLEAAEGVETACFTMQRSVHASDVNALFQVNRIVKERGPFDIVHGHSSKGGAVARLASANGARRIYTPHSLRTMDPTISKPAKLFYGAAERIFAKRTDAIICVSDAERRHSHDMKLAPRRFDTVLNGIRFDLANHRAELRAEVGLADDDVCIGFVGRFDAQKNPLRFVRAVAAASEDAPRLRAVMIGEGVLSDRVCDALESLGLSEIIHLAGAQPGGEWMCAFDVFAMSSDYEAMPYVYLEALSAGLPIVTTDVGGARETVEDDVNGFIVPVTDEMALARRIAAIANDRERRAAFAEASRSKASAFHIDAMVDATVEVYETALADRA